MIERGCGEKKNEHNYRALVAFMAVLVHRFLTDLRSDAPIKVLTDRLKKNCEEPKP